MRRRLSEGMEEALAWSVVAVKYAKRKENPDFTMALLNHWWYWESIQRCLEKEEVLLSLLVSFIYIPCLQ